MQYLGIGLWIAFIGIAVWGNWFFVIMALAIGGGGAIGLLVANIQQKNEQKELKRLLKEDVEKGNAKKIDDHTIHFIYPRNMTIRYSFSLDFID